MASYALVMAIPFGRTFELDLPTATWYGVAAASVIGSIGVWTASRLFGPEATNRAWTRSGNPRPRHRASDQSRAADPLPGRQRIGSARPNGWGYGLRRPTDRRRPDRTPRSRRARVTFNRPETMNVLERDECHLTTAIRDADTDDSIRVVVVTGSDERSAQVPTFLRPSMLATPTKETFSSDPLDPFHPWRPQAGHRRNQRPRCRDRHG